MKTVTVLALLATSLSVQAAEYTAVITYADASCSELASLEIRPNGDVSGSCDSNCHKQDFGNQAIYKKCMKSFKDDIKLAGAWTIRQNFDGDANCAKPLRFVSAVRKDEICAADGLNKDAYYRRWCQDGEEYISQCSDSKCSQNCNTQKHSFDECNGGVRTYCSTSGVVISMNTIISGKGLPTPKSGLAPTTVSSTNLGAAGSVSESGGGKDSGKDKKNSASGSFLGRCGAVLTTLALFVPLCI